MRNPNRIPVIMNKLLELWQLVPDWRFGQLVENFRLHYNIPDIFYEEDDNLLERLNNYENYLKSKCCFTEDDLSKPYDYFNETMNV